MVNRTKSTAAVLLLGWSILPGQGAEGDPQHYQRKSSWHESLLASFESVVRTEEDGFAAFDSETMHGGDKAQAISVPLGKAAELFLVASGVPDVRWAVADWGEARLVREDGSSEELTQTTNFTVLLGRCESDLTLKSGLYQKMRLNDRVFDRGLNVQADSIIRVPLHREYARFEATVGVDDWAGTNGSVRFSVVGARRGAIARLWAPLMRDFHTGQDRREIGWEREDRIFEFAWQSGDWTTLARRYAKACGRVPPLAREAERLASGVQDHQGLSRLRQDYYLRSRRLDAARSTARALDFAGTRAAIEDLTSSFPGQYPTAHLSRLDELEKVTTVALIRLDPEQLVRWMELEQAVSRFELFRREALLANPLLNFEQLLVLKRVPLGGARRTSWEGYGYGEYLGIPRQSSWNYGTMPVVNGWTNEIALLYPVQPAGKLSTLFRPTGNRLVNDLELHWDAAKLMFSMPDENRNWQVNELALPRGPSLGPVVSRQLTPSVHRDVHNYDAVYLPNDEVIFLSTAPLQGVPCNASVIVGMMYRMTATGDRIRQLTFEQDHDYTPSVLNNGRVLYLRWDYTDTPHVWNRLLMSMNPDGTSQMEYLGANSYWPNAMFFARAVPGHSSKIVTIVTGHHEGRVGELFVLDPARGRHETESVVQRIPKQGPPVLPKIEDKLTEHSWPKFLHPWPLSEKYFLVACKPEPDALWGIYLVDVFDNRTLVKEEEGCALLEPVPLQARPRPPIIADRAQPVGTNALVYMEDVYSGPGLRGVPRGTVKALRLFTYHFAYQRLAGIDHRVGADGPWEAKRVLGTVPVEDDGSAFFSVPAKMPISIQPLDAAGKALALMRSWMTAQPGEVVSCVGCHDRQNGAPPGTNRRIALNRPARPIAPWHGPLRGFSFARDVQPLLDKYCVGCHDGGVGKPDLRREQGGFVVYRGGQLDGEFVRRPKSELVGKYGAVFEPSYVTLRQYVRVGGLESDLHLLPPREFGADTSELIQMLIKGHHNVRLDDEAWDRLITWIDLNAPCHGTWAETARIPGNQVERRLELRRLYNGVAENCEAVPESEPPYEPPNPILPEKEARPTTAPPIVPGWPFGADKAKAMQAAGGPASRTVNLGGGVTMELVRVPAGSFVMGDPNASPDERELRAVRIGRSFWMAKCEVSNEQFARFDPAHDSRFEHRSSWMFDQEYIGWPLNRPRQPVVRVSWDEASAFCQWLSRKLGQPVTLPSEEQWEWACRAGTETPMSYGDLDTDFSRFANMGDANLRKLADEGWRPKSPDLVPKDARFDDGALVTREVSSYLPNLWGLHDLHGNAAEWTRSDYSTPFRVGGALGADSESGTRKVVRGGSWRDRPKLCRSASRWAYDPWQKVFNVGFRVVLESQTGVADSH